jgi:glycosyltransferase involved in cell wall biosynthesis
MKVLQLGPYPPPHGGVQSNLVAIRSFLLSRGIPCTVINITRHRKLEADNIFYPKSTTDLLRLLITLEYDIVHLHIGGILSHRLLGLGLVCSSMPRRRSVLTFHSGGYPSSPAGKATKANSFAGFVLRRFNAVIGVNPEIMDFFSRLAVSDSRTHLIYPHSLSSEETRSPMPEPLASFFAAHHPVLISVGGLEAEYDVPLQIDALGFVRNNFPDAGLIVVGSGSLEQDLRDGIRAQPHAAHILLCGDIPHSFTLEAISRAQAMLRTTLYDGDAISVREALHLWTPVIASDNGMRPAGVRLVPKSNLPALVTAIHEMLEHPTPRTAPAPADDSNLQAVLQVYEELLAGKA